MSVGGVRWSPREVRRRLAVLYGDSLRQGIYTWLKMRIIPFEQFSRYLPDRGVILEVGCGYGYVANYLSLESEERHVIGNDPAEDRVAVARRTIGERCNVEFLAADCRDLPYRELDAVVIADVLHHIPYDQQVPILEDLSRRLKPGGVLVMRETDKKWRLRYLVFNYLLEWILYFGTEKLRFRKAEEWRQILQTLGLEVREVIPNPRLFPYLTALFVCRKPGAREG